MDYGLIRDLETTTAAVHDSQVDLSREGEVVYRDKGYHLLPLDLTYINYVRSESRVLYRVAVAIDKNRKRQGFEQLGGEKRPKRDEKTEKMSKKTYWISKILKSGVNQNPLHILRHRSGEAKRRF